MTRAAPGEESERLPGVRGGLAIVVTGAFISPICVFILAGIRTEMARILKSYGEIDVPHNNVARAFRDLNGQDGVAGLWKGLSKRYEIAEGGSLLLLSIIEEDQHASAEITKKR